MTDKKKNENPDELEEGVEGVPVGQRPDTAAEEDRARMVAAEEERRTLQEKGPQITQGVGSSRSDLDPNDPDFGGLTQPDAVRPAAQPLEAQKADKPKPEPGKTPDDKK